MWVVTSIVANLIIVTLEYTYRTTGLTWSPWLLVGWVLRIGVMQWCLWYSWHNAPSLLTAWAVFAAGNAVLRLVNATVFLHESMSFVTFVGVVSVVAGVALIKIGD